MKKFDIDTNDFVDNIIKLIKINMEKNRHEIFKLKYEHSQLYLNTEKDYNDKKISFDKQLCHLHGVENAFSSILKSISDLCISPPEKQKCQCGDTANLFDHCGRCHLPLCKGCRKILCNYCLKNNKFEDCKCGRQILNTYCPTCFEIKNYLSLPK